MRRPSVHLSVVLLACACADSPQAEPRLSAVTPAWKVFGAELTITIGGEQLLPRVRSDFDQAERSGVDTRFEAWLGETALEEVRFSDRRTVTARVPAGLPVGVHALRLRTSARQEATLPQAFRVYPAVATFAFEPIAGQRVEVPFAVSVTARDADGGLVTDFDQPVLLEDDTGTLAPRSTGPFLGGTWSGEVRVDGATDADVLRARFDLLGVEGASGPFTVRPPAYHLTLAAPPWVVAGDCAALTVSRLDDLDAAAPAPAPLPLSVTSTSGAGFTLYSDAACTQVAAAPELSAGASVLWLHFASTRAGVHSLSAGAAQHAGATVTYAVIPGPPATLTVLTPAHRFLVGTCSGQVRLSAADAHANPIPGPWSADLSLAAAGGAAFHAQPGCASPIGAATAPAGAAEAVFHLRGLVGGAHEWIAQAGAAQARQPFVVQRVMAIQRGACAFAATDVTRTCALAQPVADRARTMLFFQASSAGDAPETTNLRCLLSGTTDVACDRAAAGVAIDLAYTVLEVPSGINVRHLEPTCVEGTTSVPLSPPVDPASTFLLFSASGVGQYQDANDFRAPVLVDGSTAEVRYSSGQCGAYSLQVVELPGISVTRGDAGPMALGATTLDATGLAPVDPTRTALLHGVVTPTHDPAAQICARAVRGWVTGAQGVSFQRGDGTSCASDALDAVYWERIDFGSRGRVQVATVGLAATLTSTLAPISPVDLTRAVAFTGGQWTNGQATGETSYAAGDLAGEAQAVLRLTAADRLQVARGSAGASASWTVFVLELDY